MKIYTKIVLSTATGEVIDEDSYEYTGAIAECKGGGGGSNEVQETAQERALAKVTQAEWNRYKTVYQPLMNKEGDKYASLGGTEKSDIAGAINAGVTKTYDDIKANTIDNSLKRGVGPTGMAVGLGDAGRDKASTGSRAMARGVGNVDKVKVAGLQNVVGLMRGDAGEAVAGMGQVASDAVYDANQEAAYKQQRRNDKFETGAQVVGMGLAAYNNYKPSGTPDKTYTNYAGDNYFNPTDYEGVV